MVSKAAAAAASSYGGTILIGCSTLFPVWIIYATVRMVFGFALRDCRVTLSATVPHEEEKYKSGQKEDAASDADSKSNFEAGVGRARR